MNILLDIGKCVEQTNDRYHHQNQVHQGLTQFGDDSGYDDPSWGRNEL
jgi:hypothetical protein